MTCQKPSRYSWSEAQVALEKHKKRVLFSTMEPYYCNRHECYHLGHQKRTTKKQTMRKEEALWKNQPM